MSRDTLSIYVVYDHPKDYPDSFVVREWHYNTPTMNVQTAPTLAEARQLIPFGLVRLHRSEGDDHTIVETWL
jgi:hypothetical protein